MTTTTIDMHAADLRRALHAVLPFTGQDDSEHPAMLRVHLATIGRRLTLTTSDRYTIAHAVILADQAMPSPASINADDARVLLALLDSKKEDRGTVQLEVTDSRIAIALHDSRAEVRRRDWEGRVVDQFHKILAKLPTKDAADLSGMVAIQPRYLTAIAAASVSDDEQWMPDPVRMCFGGPNEPIRAEVGDWLLAAIMPVRVAQGADAHVAAPQLAEQVAR